MPRPKVKPQDRLRAARACDACKSSKKRCDAQTPCHQCVSRGRGRRCSYTSHERDPRRPSFDPTTTSTTHPPVPEVVVGSASGGSAVSFDRSSSSQLEQHQPQSVGALSSSAHSSQHRLNDLSSSSERETRAGQDGLHDSAGPSTGVSTPDAGQKPIMMLSATGETENSQRTRREVARLCGQSQSRSLFEQPSPEVTVGPFVDDIGDVERRNLVQCYLDVSGGLLDLFSDSEIGRLSEAGSQGLGSDHNSHHDIPSANQASFYLMIAIGAQCRGASPADLACAARYFTHAQKMAFEGMLENPTTALVRTFILLAFYMLGACRRNSAFMYIGVASKCADILGLNIPAGHRQMSKEDRDIRTRTAMSLHTFDVICSSILGRRSSSLRLSHNSRSTLFPDPEPQTQRSVALQQSYEVCAVMKSVVDINVETGSTERQPAEQLLARLEEWMSKVPDTLHQKPWASAARGNDYHGSSITSIHVAGAYYFSVILLTRQFMVKHLMPKLQGQGALDTLDEENAEIAKLSRTCVTSASLLIQMAADAMDAGALHGNMCILKAWLFAAGLVLGFFLLTGDEAIHPAQDKFQRAQQVLAKLGRLSPQAQQYSGILTSLGDAIEVYKNELWQQNSRDRRNSLVQDFFHLSRDSTAARAQGDGRAAFGAAEDGDTAMELDKHGNLAMPNDTVLGPEAAGNSTQAVLDDDMIWSFLPGDWPVTEDDEQMMRFLWDSSTYDGLSGVF